MKIKLPLQSKTKKKHNEHTQNSSTVSNFLIFLTLLTIICIKYFCTLLHDKGPLGHTKRYAQLTRQNDFYIT